MFLFLGTRTTRTPIGEGDFACPQCGVDRRYRLVRLRTCFHLFWIPLIPVGSPRQGVQCSTCSSWFSPAVLDRPTASKLVDGLQRVQRLIAWVGVALDEDGRELRAARARAFLAERGWPAALADEVVASALTAGVDDVTTAADELAAAMASVAPSVGTLGLEQLILALGAVVSAAGSFDDQGRLLVVRAAAAAGFTPAHVEGLLLGIERSAQGFSS